MREREGRAGAAGGGLSGALPGGLSSALAVVADSAEGALAPGAVDALLEAMFLMAVADGDMSEPEVRQFARSCEQMLGDLEISEGDLEGMFAQFASGVAEEGWEARMRAIAATVAGTELGELSFRLAVAIALVDDRVADGEASAIETMAQALGIDPERSQVLVGEIYGELFGPRTVLCLRKRADSPLPRPRFSRLTPWKSFTLAPSFPPSPRSAASPTWSPRSPSTCGCSATA